MLRLWQKPIFIELLILARLRCHTSIQQRQLIVRQSYGFKNFDLMKEKLRMRSRLCFPTMEAHQAISLLI
jgi:hypothetical protein